MINYNLNLTNQTIFGILYVGLVISEVSRLVKVMSLPPQFKSDSAALPFGLAISPYTAKNEGS